jgi:putative transposase
MTGEDELNLYTSEAYQAFLKEHGIQVSMSRQGNCWDNAVMERFFGTLKRECTSREHFASQEQAHSTVFEYIECFLQSGAQALHSGLSQSSPICMSTKLTFHFRESTKPGQQQTHQCSSSRQAL